MPAKLDAILDACVSVVAGLGLTNGSDTVTVVKLKEPSARRGIDARNQIAVCKAERKEDVRPYAFGVFRVTYYVELTAASPGNADLQAGLPTYADWRERVRKAFGPPFPAALVPGVGGVFDLDVLPDAYLSRENMAKNRDTQTLLVAVHAQE